MWFGDPIWKHARWTHMFQTANDLTTVQCGATVVYIMSKKADLGFAQDTCNLVPQSYTYCMSRRNLFSGKQLRVK
jgi:hypothetical protein